MSTTTPQKSNVQSLPTNHKVEPPKAPEAASTAVSVLAETPKTETPAAADDPKNSKTIVSISVEPKLARQARLLAKFRGVSISSLFVDAAAKEIPVALKQALADLKDEVE